MGYDKCTIVITDASVPIGPVACDNTGAYDTVQSFFFSNISIYFQHDIEMQWHLLPDRNGPTI